MECFSAGTWVGAGSFHCERCGFAVALHEVDEMPACPRCEGRRFRRSSMFETHAEPEPPSTIGRPPDWLEQARETLVGDGDYLAFKLGGRVRLVALQEGWTRLGRSPSAHVRFDDPTVSRRHALFHHDDSGARVIDDRSLNGLFVNGERVESAELGDGDELGVGRFRIFLVTAPGRT